MQVQNSEVCLGFLPENWLCTVIFFFFNGIVFHPDLQLFYLGMFSGGQEVFC